MGPRAGLDVLEWGKIPGCECMGSGGLVGKGEGGHEFWQRQVSP